MNRSQKAQLVDVLHATFAEAGLVVITQQSGLSVAETEDLRHQMREAGARYKVTKNRLARLALQGTQYEALVDQFTGPTAIATSSDPVAAAKVVVKFADGTDKLTVVGGALGDKLLDAAGVKALASLPSLDELRGKLIGLLQAPGTKVAGVLQASAGQLVRVLNARAEQAE